MPLLAVLVFATFSQAQTEPLSFAASFQSALDAGKLADAKLFAKTQIDQNVQADSGRFALGIVQSLEGLEQLSQDLYRFGADSKITRAANLPMLRVPVPDNLHPQAVTYEQLRRSLTEIIAQFDQAEQTLEAIKDPAVTLPLRLDSIRLDLTGDGKTQPVPLAQIFGILTSATDEPTTQTAEPFVLHLDAGDVYWLRGYCHLLCAIGNAVLAYDEHELFDTTAQLFFAKPKTSFPFLKHEQDVGFDFATIADAVAVVHQLHLNVVEPPRLFLAHYHFKAMLQCSRDSWKSIQAETDDDHEWIPNPKQHSPLPTLQVTQEQIDAWLKFVDEADSLFDGKTLIPFWRGSDDTMGVNLNKVFTEPKPFDLVLWVQGSAAGPYLEKGPITNKDVYTNLERVFEGNVFVYAFWFN